MCLGVGMLKWYGYLGLALLMLANINFILVIQPLAEWYIPIVWFGYIMFIDSIVYYMKGRSLMSNHAKEFAFMALVSVPFWLIFEIYNVFTNNWTYINYIWYVHIVDFTTIMPAVLETFTLVMALEVFSGIKLEFPSLSRKRRDRSPKSHVYLAAMPLMILGVIAVFLPLFAPYVGFPFVWIGLFLLLDPINYILGRDSIVLWCSRGKGNRMLQLFFAGIIMGLFWEFWNYMAYPKWIYNIPLGMPMLKLFEMPLVGYLGYLPFALDVYLFYELSRALISKSKNPVISL